MKPVKNVSNSPMSAIKIVSELGKGAHGIVYKVEHEKFPKQFLVLKEIKISHLTNKGQADALQEVQILRKISHPNIIKYYDSFIDGNKLYILMEYAEKGDLYAVFLLL